MRRRATAVLKWFSALYVVLIVIQVYLAGEGIFGLNVIKHSDDCDKHGANLSRRALHRQLEDARRASRARVLPDAPRRAPLPDRRADRVAPQHAHPDVSILVPILTFVQMILPGAGRWGGALHPVNAILILGMYLWLFLTLRKEAPAAATEPVAAPSG